MVRSGLLVGTALAFAASMPVEGHVPQRTQAGQAPQARAELHDAKGNAVGHATFTQRQDGVLIRLQARNLPPGLHGFHIHETGECHAPDFKSAGGHFNPEGKQHGLLNPNGPHAGDLPNLAVKPDGTVQTEVLAKRVTLKEGSNSLLKEGGTSLVIHSGPDDYHTNPAGNAGDRIACGTITRMAP